MRILIVDDHELTRRSLRSLLTSGNEWFVCGEAADGLEAVEKARELRPDVILMDISMPRLDGLQASQIIRRESPGIQIIVVGRNEAGVAEPLAQSAGAKAYVTKGNLAQDLLPVLEKLSKWEGEKQAEGRAAGTNAQTGGRGGAAEAGARDHRFLDDLIALQRLAGQEGSYLAAIVDSSDDAIVSKNLDGVITSWNASAERLFGYTAEEAIGRSITLIIPPDRLGEERQILEQLKHGERVDHFETVRVRKDGSLVDISVTISPVKDVHGIIIGASKTARDVTARKRVEHDLAMRAKQQKALFQLANDSQNSESVEHVCTAAIKAIVNGLGCDRASILLYDEAGVMRYACWRSLSDEYRRATEGHSPWELEETKAMPICVSDVNKSDLGESLKRTIQAEGIGALAFIPLIAEGKLIGKFMTYYDASHTFSEEEVDLSLTIARHLAGQIHLKRSEETLRQSEERLRRLADSLDAEVRARTKELEQRNADVLRQTEQLRELSWRIMRIQDEERRHIARELHDSAGQTLAVLAMKLAALLRRTQEASPEFAQEVAENESLVQSLNQEIRTMSYLLHPPLLDESGLAAALGWYVQGLTERSGLEIKLSIGDGFGRLPSDMELMIFRLVQECLTNIHRHSESRCAAIQLQRHGGRVSVQVEDRGKGIPAQKLEEIQSQGSGVGIRGMKERIRQFQGEMRIESSEGGDGTRVSVVLRVPETATETSESEQFAD